MCHSAGRIGATDSHCYQTAGESVQRHRDVYRYNMAFSDVALRVFHAM